MHQTHTSRGAEAGQAEAAEKVPYPEYQPRSYRELSTLLGESDSGLEWMEVGLRHLRAEHAAGGGARMDELAALYKVKVNAFDWSRVATQWARLQIVSVQQYVEWFLDEFRREFERHFRQRDRNEDEVRYTLDVLKVSERSVGTLEVAILDYYRLIRNRFLHDPEAEEPKRLETRRATIRKVLPGSLYAKLDAPNEADNAQFDDFVLFSRALKNFSRRLCAHAFPLPDELFGVIRKDSDFLKELRRHQQDPRLPLILAGYIRRRFGFALRAQEIAAILLRDGLLAQLEELPLQEPTESRSVAEGGGRGSSPRRVTKKGRGG